MQRSKTESAPVGREPQGSFQEARFCRRPRRVDRLERVFGGSEAARGGPHAPQKVPTRPSSAQEKATRASYQTTTVSEGTSNKYVADILLEVLCVCKKKCNTPARQTKQTRRGNVPGILTKKGTTNGNGARGLIDVGLISTPKTASRTFTHLFTQKKHQLFAAFTGQPLHKISPRICTIRSIFFCLRAPPRRNRLCLFSLHGARRVRFPFVPENLTPRSLRSPASGNKTNHMPERRPVSFRVFN